MGEGYGSCNPPTPSPLLMTLIMTFTNLILPKKVMTLLKIQLLKNLMMLMTVGRFSNDPGEGTSNQPDTADNSHQATADSGERTGCVLIMCYNRLRNISDYWSMQESMGNVAIKKAISRNRFQLLMSKLYFNLPNKPENATKTYYVDELVSCLKHTFPEARTEATFQSIDESMAKFKGKDLEKVDGSLGERVVGKLSSTVRGDKEEVVLSFDRFFTSVKLLCETRHPSVATCIGNREGVVAVSWKDSKQFVVLSNLHSDTVTTVKRMQQNGERKDVTCPEAIALYNEIMGGVDISDQKVGVYDFDRKSKKWWKKVFYKLLLTSVVNAWILHQEVQHRKTSLLTFMVPLAEQLLAEGSTNTSVKRRASIGRTSKRVKTMSNVGTHLPVEGQTRRRCKRCSDHQTENRTKTMCAECDLPLCSREYLLQ
ncbi:uncharacterized protein LOC124368188 [Homalodisca vitripennis]|uniref:uncharacterized protein LOC124368188 n=1 Tax=Homalodisca vitripennis TaxID=197043 RepID=UPI001EEC0492|nr:uncharacterized protein LOC124368188 [Homalodisca vitripennis]